MTRESLSKFFSDQVDYGGYDFAMVVGSTPAETLLKCLVQKYELDVLSIFDWARNGIMLPKAANELLDDLVVQNVIAPLSEGKLLMCYCADYGLGLVLFNETAVPDLGEVAPLMLEAGHEAKELIRYYREETWTSMSDLDLWDGIRQVENPSASARIRPN